MKYYLLSKVELEARGWRSSPNTSFFELPGMATAGRVPLDLLRTYGGREIELDPFEQMAWFNGWRITPPMLRCARINTRAEFEALGWTDDGHCFNPPAGSDNAYCMPRGVTTYEAMGKWVPVPDRLPEDQFEVLAAYRPYVEATNLLLTRHMLAEEQWATVLAPGIIAGNRTGRSGSLGALFRESYSSALEHEVDAMLTHVRRLGEHIFYVGTSPRHELHATNQPINLDAETMQVLVKSREELARDGVTDTWGLPEEIFGKLIDVTYDNRSYRGQPVFRIDTTIDRHGGRWCITANMLHVARCLTKDELLAAGWTIVGNNIVTPDGSPITNIQTLTADGDRWIPTHNQNHVYVYAIDHSIDRRRVSAVAPEPSYTPQVFRSSVPTSTPVATQVVWQREAVAVQATPRQSDEERRAATKVAMEAFRDAELTAARDLITCGFELETQATDGLNKYSRGDVDQARLDSWVAARVDDCLYNVRRYVSVDTAPVQQLTEILKPAIREKARLDDFRKPGHQTISDRVNYPKLQVVEDGTVQGFELRTVGGLTVAEFEQACDTVFTLPHEVNEECSFHIHLAVNGISHKYGANMQMALIEYLVQNMPEVPESVRKRWANAEWRDQYFGADLSDEKYTFVHKHPQNTWEFRCFGNVKNAADAKKCLELAIRAMQHAYKVTSGQAPSFASRLADDVEWTELVNEALDNSTTLDAALERNSDLSSAA